jgi:hypothetical protein
MDIISKWILKYFFRCLLPTNKVHFWGKCRCLLFYILCSLCQFWQNHHQGDYNFKWSEASKIHTCMYVHWCCVYHTSYQTQVVIVLRTSRPDLECFMSLEIVISLMMVWLKSKYVGKCMLQNNRYWHLSDKHIFLVVNKYWITDT